MNKVVEYKGLQAKNVIQSHEITRSAQRLSLVEKRILMMALAESGGFLKPLKLYAQDYADTFDLDIAVAYKELKDASFTFLKKQFTLTEERKNKRNKIYEIKLTYNWLSYIGYTQKEAFIEVKFNPDIQPLLFDLTSQFTKYQLKQASALRSIYSIRLLELFESVRQSKIIRKDNQGRTEKTKKQENGWLKIHIDDFNHAMEAPASYKANFAQLKRKIIEPAIKELEQKDGWKIEFKTKKQGRKIALLEFEFYRDPQGQLF